MTQVVEETQDMAIKIEIEKFFFLCELAESLPSAMLQVCISLTYGGQWSLDPSSSDFNGLLAMSCAFSILGSGSTLLSFEAWGRGAAADINIISLYGFTTLAWRSLQLALTVLSFALLGCHINAHVIWPAAVTCYVALLAVREANKRGWQGQRPVLQWNGAHLGCVAVMIALFYLLPPAKNNFINPKLERSITGEGYLDCQAWSFGSTLAAGSLGGSLLFGAASLGLDPMQSQSGDANMGQAPDKGLLSTGGADIMK